MGRETVARKGQRERIHPVWDGPAYLMDTAGLSLVTQAVWMAWLVGCLYDPAHGGRATKSVDEWARIGRCSVEQAEVALDELAKNGTAEVSKNRRCHGLVTLMSRRVFREYKLKEENRLRQVRHRMSRLHNKENAILSQNGVLTVRKKDPSDPEEILINRNEKKDHRTASVSVSVSGDTSTSPEKIPIPNPITKDDIWSFPDVVRLAAAICGEPKSLLTRNTFRKAYRTIGDPEFRGLLAAFFSELDNGEVPNRLGAAFTARLKDMVKAAEARRKIRESLASVPAPCRFCGNSGLLNNVPVPDGDGFQEGQTRELPCGFCPAGQREMERQGLSRKAQMEIVQHEMAVLGVNPTEFARETPA